MDYKCLLIDLDDTIWDTYANSKESMKEVYRDYGFDHFFSSFEEYFSIFINHNYKLWEQYRHGKITKDELIVERLLYPLRPFGYNDKEFAFKLNDDYLQRTTLKTKLTPYAKETLMYLHHKYKMYIISNGFKEVQYAKINNSGLDVFFDGVFLSDEIGYNKPHPEIFRQALLQTDSKADETVVIGDSWDADIVGAKNSRIDQIYYDPAGNSSEKEFKPTYRIKNLLELKDIL